jgi:hypothetical protein
VLFAGFTPVPNTHVATVDQAGGFIFLDQLSRENHLFQLRDNRLTTSVPARNTHCLIVNTTKMVLSLLRVGTDSKNLFIGQYDKLFEEYWLSPISYLSPYRG